MYKIIIFSFALIVFSACQEKEIKADAYGNFEATSMTVSAESLGELITLNVEEGQHISSGEFVALVDTNSLHLQRSQIDATINALPKKLRTALADIEVLKNQKANLVRERNRLQRLVNKKAATPKQLDDINGEINVVNQRILAVQSQTSTANRSILAEKEPLLAQKAIISNNIQKAYIYNPVSGTVLTKLAEAHEIVNMGSPLYRIGQLDTMTLRFYASATQLQSVALGQSIEVLVDQGANEYKKLKGQITWIANQAEFTPKTIQTKEDRVNLVYAVKAAVANPNGLLKIGMPAEVNFYHTTTASTE